MKRLFAASLLIWGVLLPWSPAAQAAATAAEVLQQARAASGGTRWNAVAQIELRGTMSVGDLHGTYNELVSLRDARRVASYDLSVLAGAEGFDGSVPWHSDAAGLVDVDTSDSGRQRSLATSFISNRRFLDPTLRANEITLKRIDGFDVISIATTGSAPVQLWVDPHTHLVVRSALPESKEETRWLDYRKVGGLLLPHRLESTDGNNNVQTVLVERYVIRAKLDEPRFARPRSNLRDTEIRAEGRTLPAYIEGGHVYIEASLNEAGPALFVLDTGASINVLTPAAAGKFGVDAGGSLNGSGVGEQQVSVGLTKIPKLRVGPATLLNQSFAVISLPPLTVRREGREEQAAGLLGYDFFRRLRITIDYEASVVKVEPLRSCDYEAARAVRMYLDDQRVPRIPVAISGIEARWSLDVGDAASLTMSATLAQRFGVPPEAGIATVSEGGVGGVTRGRLLQFDHVTVGPYRLDAPIVTVSEQKSGAFADPRFGGNIGYGTLRNFILTFDYECQRLELAPSRRYGTATPVEALGVTWQRNSSGNLQVLDVMQGSPADAAGVHEGDELIDANGMTGSQLTKGELRELQSQPPGSALTLTLRRAGRPYEVKVVLGEFIPKFAH